MKHQENRPPPRRRQRAQSAPSSPTSNKTTIHVNQPRPVQRHSWTLASKGGRLTYQSPRIELPDQVLFPGLDCSEHHDVQWKSVSVQAGPHQQDGSVLVVHPRIDKPVSLKYGMPAQAATRVTTLYLPSKAAEGKLPEWLDVVVSTFANLQHLYLSNTAFAEARNLQQAVPASSTDLEEPMESPNNSQRLRRLYILYRLPHLESIDGTPVSQQERRYARPPNGQRVKRDDWVNSLDDQENVQRPVSHAALGNNSKPPVAIHLEEFSTNATASVQSPRPAVEVSLEEGFNVLVLSPRNARSRSFDRYLEADAATLSEEHLIPPFSIQSPRRERLLEDTSLKLVSSKDVATGSPPVHTPRQSVEVGLDGEVNDKVFFGQTAPPAKDHDDFIAKLESGDSVNVLSKQEPDMIDIDLASESSASLNSVADPEVPMHLKNLPNLLDDEKKEEKEAIITPRYGLLSHKDSLDMDRFTYVSVESSAHCDWSAACGSLHIPYFRPESARRIKMSAESSKTRFRRGSRCGKEGDHVVGNEMTRGHAADVALHVAHGETTLQRRTDSSPPSERRLGDGSHAISTPPRRATTIPMGPSTSPMPEDRPIRGCLQLPLALGQREGCRSLPTTPTRRVPGSKSLTSPFPMQFRARVTAPPSPPDPCTNELSVSTALNGPGEALNQLNSRPRPPVLTTIDTSTSAIETPIPLLRVKSSPSKLGRKAGMLPPPVPGRKHTSLAPNAVRIPRKSLSRWRQKMSARSTSIIDGVEDEEEDDDDTDCSSDEENLFMEDIDIP